MLHIWSTTYAKLEVKDYWIIYDKKGFLMNWKIQEKN